MARLQLIKSEFARQSFIEMNAVFDRDALPLSVEQCVDGQAAPPFTKSHDDPVSLGEGP